MRHHDRTSTEVTGGENRRRTMVNHRAVHAVEPLGRPVAGERLEIAVAAAASGDGCAVLVQDRSLVTLHAAALCPDRDRARAYTCRLPPSRRRAVRCR